ncbi:DUF445 family protein [Schnuerera ultunensis]|uniref:DUF445 family protein n=1 Tax=Schnuerera ultunensis TaxID=45497 RepID=UPI00041D0217|nr:DUF445 family protein [Schnuerera ultunensis]
MKFIIPILLGATIGYITNWIAIKMLFRPHYEKKIFNIHVPFTPGLIPKERERIAKSIGDAVGVYLLSPEVVVKSLSNDKNDYIKKWVKSYIGRLQREDRSIKSLVSDLGHGKHNEILSLIKVKVTEIICLELRKDIFKQKLIRLIDEYIFINSKDELYQIINEKIELFLYQLTKSEETMVGLKDIIVGKLKELSTDERPLTEVIPENIIFGIKDMVAQHDEEIGEILKNILNDSRIELELKGWITKVASNNMNKLVAIFMSPETISDKVFDAIKEFVNKPEINDNIATVIITLIDKIFENKVGNIASIISTNLDGDQMLKLSNLIIQYISKEENQSKIINIINKRLKSEKANIRGSILNFMSKELETFFDSKILYDNIFSIIDDIIEKIMDKPMSSVAGNIDDRTVSNIASFCNIIFNDFVRNKLPHIVQVFNISRVVEDQINSYDMAFVEELILEIAHKELKAITWLGALLGGMMGIILPILQGI